MGMGGTQERFDDEIYCITCKEPLRYDRENRQWRAKFQAENSLITDRCYDPRLHRWDHEPRKNPGRLIRAIKRMQDKKRMGLA